MRVGLLGELGGMKESGRGLEYAVAHVVTHAVCGACLRLERYHGLHVITHETQLPSLLHMPSAVCAAVWTVIMYRT